jgi:ABC-type lipoprotein export system ATPase subunit
MKIIQFYKKNVIHYSKELKALKKQLFLLSIIRFTVFLLSFYMAYKLSATPRYAVTAFIIVIAIFLFLVARYVDLLAKKDKIQALKALNELELEVINGTISKLDLGTEFINPQHYFSYDIDLFGAKSFFQFLNRTATQAGKQKLATILTANNIDAIENKQKAIQELSVKKDWMHEFRAVASLIKTEILLNDLVQWVGNYSNFLPKIIRLLPSVFSLITVLLAIAIYFQFVPSIYFYVWFSFGLILTGRYLKKLNTLYFKVSKLKDTFVQNHQLIKLIEEETFESEFLKNKKQQIQEKDKKASEILKAFSKALEAFDYRNNIIFAIFGNGLFLWDLKQAYRIEQWLEKYNGKVADWFDVIAYFDAQISLANYAYNHHNYVYPIININNNKSCIIAQDLGHPLLKPKQRVDNDFNIANNEFFIITGANMAGKSTFLRTVSLSIIMANVGLPVCAKKMQYNPIKLITSMRTSDSLSDDESYFFSELKRLKFIVDNIAKERYFIILDEILKGTNSTDKAEGSYKFIKRLLTTQATGIIATHDLSLCKLSEEETAIQNHYFDAEIIADELFFDYKFKAGICQNMNASFLLKKMKIV